MSQHDTLTLREALRSIQYEAASLADAQVIALQALNATYPARAALSATQPAQAAQPVQGLAPLLERIRPGVAAAPWVVEALQKLAAQAAQGAGEVVAIHPSWLDCWSFNECDRLARIWTAGIDLTKSDDHDNDLGPQWKVVMAIMLARLAHRAAVAPTQPAAGADVPPAQPAPVVPGKPFTGAQRMRLWQNTEKGKSAVSLAAFERIVQTVEAAHRITAAPTPPAQAAADARDAELPPDGADRGAEAERAAMYGTFGG